MTVSTVLIVSCLLFSYSRCPRAQPFVKVGGMCPPCPWSRRHCSTVPNRDHATKATPSLYSLNSDEYVLNSASTSVREYLKHYFKYTSSILYLYFKYFLPEVLLLVFKILLHEYLVF